MALLAHELSGTRFLRGELEDSASAPSKDDGKKLILPHMVPGFKASSLEVGKSPVPYIYVHGGSARLSAFPT